MHASMAGEVVPGVASLVPSRAGLEAIKWTAFALMVLDHLSRYAIHGLGPVPWLLGRMVFPLFAISLAVGCAGSTSAQRRSMIERLALWSLIAQAAMMLAVPGVKQMNVLATFAVGVIWWQTAHAGVRSWQWWLASSVGLLVACASEFGPLGAALVAVAMWWGQTRTRTSLVALVVCTALLTPINGSLFALLALPLAWALLYWPVEIPRVRRLFYTGYVLQWLFVAGAAYALG